MRKIFTFCAACLASVALLAAETTLWTGDKAISWNGEEYAGEQFDTSSDPTIDFTGLKAEDTIRVYIGNVEEGAQFVLSYKAGDNWAWTDLDGVSVLGDTVMEYPVASDEIANFIAGRGLIIKGIKFHAKRIAVAAKAEEQPENPQPLQPGETKVLWEGSETLAWNEVAEQPASIGALLAENDQLIVTVSAKGTADWPKVLLRDASSNSVGDDILLNDISEFPYEAVFTLTTVHAAALQGGFKLCGDGVTVTKLVLKKYKEEEQPEIPAEEYLNSTVWTGDMAISWNPEAYAGAELDTYNVQQDMLAGLAKDDSIKIYYADAIDGAQFALTYKAGDGWNWTDLVVSLHDGFFAYKVASDAIAQDIADHGLVVRGQGYHATRIVIGKPKSATGIDDVQSEKTQSTKVLRGGQLFIIRDGKTCNAFGQPVNQ